MIVLLLALLAGCPGPPCGDDGDCSDGAACDLDVGRCVAVECLESAQCPTGQHCDQEAYACEPGCLADTDCFAGEHCDTAAGTCLPSACRTAVLDCAYGEVCDGGSGACVEDPDPHCAPAETSNARFNCQNAGGTVACWEADASGCTGAYHCVLPCDPALAEPCPRGLTCEDPFGQGPVCYGDCPVLVEHGL